MKCQICEVEMQEIHFTWRGNRNAILPEKAYRCPNCKNKTLLFNTALASFRVNTRDKPSGVGINDWLQISAMQERMKINSP